MAFCEIVASCGPVWASSCLVKPLSQSGCESVHPNACHLILARRSIRESPVHLHPTTCVDWIEYFSSKTTGKEKQSFIVGQLNQNERATSSLHFYLTFLQGLIWLTMDDSSGSSKIHMGTVQWQSNKHHWVLANHQKQGKGIPRFQRKHGPANTLTSGFWPQGLWDSMVLL